MSIWSIASGKHMRSYRASDSDLDDLGLVALEDEDEPGGKAVTSFAEAASCDRVAIDEAGVHCAACCADGAVRLFDFYSGHLLATARGHGGPLAAARFLADGARFVSAGGDGAVFVWTLAPHLARVADERAAEISTGNAELARAESSDDGSADKQTNEPSSSEAIAPRLESVFARASPVPAWASTKPPPHEPHAEGAPSRQSPRAEPRGKWAHSSAAAAACAARPARAKGS